MSDRAADLLRSMDRPGAPWWMTPLRGAARAASWGYGLGVRANNLCFDLQLKKTHHLPTPVVGVGNIVAGGTGKTPLVIEVVRALGALGLPSAVISRGYGGSADAPFTWVWRDGGEMAGADRAGDEPLLIARACRVPVAVGPDRLAVGREVLRAVGRVVLVADDLYQHRRLHRDLNIVTLDAENPFGGGNLLPRGMLREPVAALARADAVVITRAGNPERADRARQALRPWLGSRPVLTCDHRVLALRGPGGESAEPGALSGARVLAFCGLARPGQFGDTLRSLGMDVAEVMSFGDHHGFSTQDLARVQGRATRLGVRALVCSEKDRVRLEGSPPLGLPLWSTELGLYFHQGPEALQGLLAWGLANWRES